MAHTAHQGLLFDRVALVTGAGSGVGHGIAQVLAARGWKVAVNDLDADLAHEVAAEVAGLAVPGDPNADTDAVVRPCVEVFGRIDGLVNNADRHSRADLADLSREQMVDLFHTNLEAPVRMMQACLAHLELSGGSIVNVASVAGPLTGEGLYPAMAAALAAVTRQAAAEWGSRGIRANLVAPAMVRTAMSEVVHAQDSETAEAESSGALRRFGSPVDVGGAVAYLLSGDAAFVTGEVLAVDGGSRVVSGDLMRP